MAAPDPVGAAGRRLLGADYASVGDLWREGLWREAWWRAREAVRAGPAPGDGPRLTTPVSQGCTQSQFSEPSYAYWCAELREAPRTHRKQWEFCYILQALSEGGYLKPGRRGLGFGVGGEPLSAIFADRGVAVVATDLAREEAERAGWVASGQHASALAELNARAICPPERFAALVEFRVADMNAIPSDLVDFDFVWSACALEHLGSIRHGLDFILRSLDCLAPGGMAVHTTEFNVADGPSTMDNHGTVLFRRRDLEGLIREARRRGFRCRVDWRLGEGELDKHIDAPPYSVDRHLKLELEGYVTTSFGLIITRPGRRGSALREGGA